MTTRAAPLRIRLFLVAAVLLFSEAVCAGSPDWPGFRGPAGDGRLVAGLPEGRGDLRLEVRWRRPIGSGYSGISLAGNLAVTASSDGTRDFVLGVDPETGAELWRADLGPMTAGLAGSKDGPISTPAIGAGRVFMVSTAGRLVALEQSSGQLLWSADLVNDLGSGRPAYGFSTSPLVEGNLVLVQAGGERGALVAFEARTGAVRWRAFEDGHYAQSPVVTELAGRRQVVVIGSTKLAAFDPRTGDELWSHEHGGAGEFGPESTSPLPIGGDRLFVKHDNERTSVLKVVVQDDETLAVEVAAESRTLTRSYSPPTFWDAAAYGYTSRFLSALDLTTGEELWRSRAPGDGFLIAVAGQLFIVNKNDGTVHLGAASRDGWSASDELELFDDLVWTPPSFRDGAFYVRSLTELARVDLVRRAASTNPEMTQSLPAELEQVRQAVAAGRAGAVADLLDGLEGPRIDGERVLFLWRGEATEVGIAGDMFGFRYDEPMQRLEGTDLWWKELYLDRRGRFNYAYFPDYVPTLDPLNLRSVESTAMGPDLNHRANEALQMSWFAMPDYPGAKSVAPEPEPRGRLESFDVSVEIPPPPRGPGAGQPPQTVTVPVTVWLPPGYDDGEERYPVALSLERYAATIGDWPATLDEVVGETVAPLIAVMIDAPPGFYGRRGGGRAGLLAPEVIAAVDRRYRTRAVPEERAVLGALYTGPPALQLSLGSDRLFARVAVQSPFAIDAMLPMYRRQIEAAREAARPAAFYFEWSYWDMRSRLEGLVLKEYMRDLYELFSASGYDVIGGEVWDSTDWAGWRNRSGLVLEALFPSARGDARSRFERWRVASE
ncbi:MAG: PQQ-binding-like beta-propeller repeat protein [Acidobacteriota bacterium]